MICTLLLAFLPTAVQQPQIGDASASRQQEGPPAALSLPLAFVENRGQWDTGAALVARRGALSVLVWHDRFELLLRGAVGEGVLLRIAPEGAREDATLVTRGRHPGGTHYLRGDDPEEWIRAVPAWSAARLEGLLPGVDLVLRDGAGQVEYDLHLAPGVDPAGVVMRCEGAEELAVGEDGTLQLSTAHGTLAQLPPVAWQLDEDGTRLPRECQVERLGGERFRFVVEERDPERATVVDPGLAWSSFLGGSSWESAYAVAVEPNGTAVITGQTGSQDFPTTPGAYDVQYNGHAFSDVFVTRVNATGTQMIYSTFLGGSAGDEGCAVWMDSSGVVTVAGVTSSPGFPTTSGAYQSSLSGSSDAFVAQLSANGAALNYSTLLGGSGGDVARGVKVDGSGRPVVAGVTDSSDFPTTPGAVQGTLAGSSDAFVARLDAGGAALHSSTLLGGSDGDTGDGLALDGNGDALLVGTTSSADFPVTPGAFDAQLDGFSDVFVARVDAAGSTLGFATLVGGSDGDSGNDVEVDAQGRAVVAGVTSSTDFPVTAGAWDVSPAGSSDAFLCRLDAGGGAMDWATFLGGSSGDVGFHLSLDASDGPVVGGVTSSPDFPTTQGAVQTTLLGSSDAFVARLDAGGATLAYGTLIGGSSGDVGEAMDADAAGTATLAGTTSSSDYPVTAGAFDAQERGSSEAFVSRIATDSGGCAGPVLSLSGLTAGGNATFQVDCATPGGSVGFGLSLAGPGPSSVPAGSCGTIQVDLSPPLQILGFEDADGSGTATLAASVPANASGTTIWSQALDLSSCALSNGVSATVQ